MSEASDGGDMDAEILVLELRKINSRLKKIEQKLINDSWIAQTVRDCQKLMNDQLSQGLQKYARH